MRDVWSPQQYERFKDERAQPFFDLLALVQPAPAMRVVDLGSGTGELTRILHDRLGAARTVGLDSSAAMLEKAAPFAAEGLTFVLGDIEGFSAPAGSLDLVFSNAALHWVEGHEDLLGRLTVALAPKGQLAVQVPANHDHPASTVAAEVAAEPPFAEALQGFVRRSPVLLPEAYARILHRLGFAEQSVRLQVYGHVLESRDGVVEWVRGTTLTAYERRLPPEIYRDFLARYREKLASVLEDTRPHFFAFKRILLWARRG